METAKRQLNSNFFDKTQTHSQITGSSPAVGADPQVLNLDRQVLDLRKKQEALQDQINQIISQLSESSKNNQLRFERVANAITKTEQGHNALVLEAGQKLSQMNQRLQERKSMDQKVQEMIDRHHGVLRGFEVRLSQLQKLIAEKDAQILSAQTSLNEAKMEISRLRRMEN